MPGMHAVPPHVGLPVCVGLRRHATESVLPGVVCITDLPCTHVLGGTACHVPLPSLQTGAHTVRSPLLLAAPAFTAMG